MHHGHYNDRSNCYEVNKGMFPFGPIVSEMKMLTYHRPKVMIMNRETVLFNANEQFSVTSCLRTNYKNSMRWWWRFLLLC